MAEDLLQAVSSLRKNPRAVKKNFKKIALKKSSSAVALERNGDSVKEDKKKAITELPKKREETNNFIDKTKNKLKQKLEKEAKRIDIKNNIEKLQVEADKKNKGFIKDLFSDNEEQQLEDKEARLEQVAEDEEKKKNENKKLEALYKANEISNKIQTLDNKKEDGENEYQSIIRRAKEKINLENKKEELLSNARGNENENEPNDFQKQLIESARNYQVKDITDGDIEKNKKQQQQEEENKWKMIDEEGKVKDKKEVNVAGNKKAIKFLANVFKESNNVEKPEVVYQGIKTAPSGLPVMRIFKSKQVAEAMGYKVRRPIRVTEEEKNKLLNMNKVLKNDNSLAGTSGYDVSKDKTLKNGIYFIKKYTDKIDKQVETVLSEDTKLHKKFVTREVKAMTKDFEEYKNKLEAERKPEEATKLSEDAKLMMLKSKMGGQLSLEDLEKLAEEKDKNSFSPKGAFSFEDIKGTKAAEESWYLANKLGLGAKTPQEAVDKLGKVVQLMRNNTVAGIATFANKNKLSKEDRKKLLSIYKIYEHSDVTLRKGAKAVAIGLTDPVNAIPTVGKGIGKGISKAIQKEVEKKAVHKIINEEIKKEGIKKISKGEKVYDVIAGVAIPGAGSAAGEALSRKSLGDKDVDMTKSALAGAAMGLMLGTGGHIAGKAFSKAHTELMKRRFKKGKWIKDDGKLVMVDPKTNKLIITDPQKFTWKAEQIKKQEIQKEHYKEEPLEEYRKRITAEAAKKRIDDAINGKISWLAEDENEKLYMPNTQEEKQIKNINKEVAPEKRIKYTMGNYSKGLRDAKMAEELTRYELSPVAKTKGRKPTKKIDKIFQVKFADDGRMYEIKTDLDPKTSKANKQLIIPKKDKGIKLLENAEENLKVMKPTDIRGNDITLSKKERIAFETDYRLAAVDYVLRHEQKNMTKAEIEKTRRYKQKLLNIRKKITEPDIGKEQKKKVIDKEREERLKTLNIKNREREKEEQDLRRMFTIVKSRRHKAEEQINTNIEATTNEIEKYIKEHKANYYKTLDEEMDKSNGALVVDGYKANKTFYQKIKHFQQAVKDLEDLKNGKISKEEAAYRQQVRTMKEFNNFKHSKPTIDEYNEYAEKITEITHNLGIEPFTIHQLNKDVVKVKGKIHINRNEKTKIESREDILKREEEDKNIQEKIKEEKGKLKETRKYLIYAIEGELKNRPSIRVSGIAIGEHTLSQPEKEYIRLFGRTKNNTNGLTAEQIADEILRIKKDMTYDEWKLLNNHKLNTERLIRKTIEEKAKRIGVRVPFGITMKYKLISVNKVYDMKNSIAVIAGHLFNDNTILQKFKDGIDFRQEVVDRIKDERIDKEFVKKVFMPREYGQGRESAIKVLYEDFGKDRDMTKEQVGEAYDRILEELVEMTPSLTKMRAVLTNIMDEKEKFDYKLPDGTKIEVKKKGEEGKVKTTLTYPSGKTYNYRITMTGDEKINGIRLLSIIIHSMDAYTYRQQIINTPLIGSHDSFAVATTKEQEQLYKGLKKTLNSISGLGNDILKQIGYKGEKIGEEKLTDIPIENMMDEELEKTVEAKLKEPNYVWDARTVVYNALYGLNHRQMDAKRYVRSLIEERMHTGKQFDKYAGEAIEQAIRGKFEPEKIEMPQGWEDRARQHYDAFLKDVFIKARATFEEHQQFKNLIKGKELTKSLEKDLKKTQEERISNGIEYIAKIMRKEKLEDLKKNRRFVEKQYNYVFAEKSSHRKKESWKTTLVVNRRQKGLEFIRAGRIQNQLLKTFKTENQINPKQLDLMKDTGYFMRQVKNNMVNDTFYKIFYKTKARIEDIANKVTGLEKTLKEKIKQSKYSEEELHDLIVKKNGALYTKLSEADKQLAREHWKELSEEDKKYVERMSKAIQDKSERYGYATNNVSNWVRTKYGDLEATEQAWIAKQMSIMTVLKALGKNGQKKVDEMMKEKEAKYIIDVHAENQIQGRKLFVRNPENFIFNYQKEIYEKDLIEDSRNPGLIPNRLDEARLTASMEEAEIPEEVLKKGSSEVLKYAEENKILITDYGYYKVKSAEERTKAGRKDDLVATLTGGYESILKKKNKVSQTKDLIDLAEQGILLSKEPGKHLVKIPEDIKKGMPVELKDIEYVHKSFMNDMLGRKEVRIIANSIIDRIARDMTLRFKRMSTLFNPSSHGNAIAQNLSLGTMVGLTPYQIKKYHREAMTMIQEFHSLMEQKGKLEAAGKDTSKIDKKLKHNDFAKLVKEGMSTNMIDGEKVLENFSAKQWEKAVKKLPQWTQSLLNNTLATSGSYIEKQAIRSYSWIDAAGRYTIAKGMIENGYRLSEAIKTTNGLFGDMRQIAPAYIEILDKYPLAPFMHWGSQTIPTLLAVTKNNPLKTIAVTGIVYAIGQEIGMNTDGWNPIAGLVDFTGDNTIDEWNKLAYWDSRDTYQVAVSPVLPAYIKKMTDNALYAKIDGRKRRITKEDIIKVIKRPQGRIITYKKDGRIHKIDTRSLTERLLDGEIEQKNN